MAKTDKKTLELIALANKQKQEIAKIERPEWRTNRCFSYVEGSSNVINLAVESNPKSLIAIAAFLMDREGSYQKAAEALGVENPSGFTWGGYPLSDWLADLKLRVARLQIDAKRRKLELLEAKLTTMISPEKRAELELEAIEKELAT